MCERHPDRDARGRLLPGHTANPRGRPPVSRYAKLFAAAAELGAVVVLLPPQARAVKVEPPTDLPPVAA